MRKTVRERILSAFHVAVLGDGRLMRPATKDGAGRLSKSEKGYNDAESKGF